MTGSGDLRMEWAMSSGSIHTSEHDQAEGLGISVRMPVAGPFVACGATSSMSGEHSGCVAEFKVDWM